MEEEETGMWEAPIQYIQVMDEAWSDWKIHNVQCRYPTSVYYNLKINSGINNICCINPWPLNIL